MAYFSYKAIDQTGNIISGKLWATSTKNIERHFTNNNLKPIAYKKIKDHIFSSLLGTRINQKSIRDFFFHLHILLKSHVPITSALKIISEQISCKKLSIAVRSIVSNVEDGESLSNALAINEGIFSEGTIQLIKAAEETNSLARQCLNISQNIDDGIKFTKEIKNQLRYPLFTLIVFLVVCSILLHEVLPQIIEFLSQGGQKNLDGLHYLVNINNFVQNTTVTQVAAIIAVPCAIIFAIKIYYKNTIPKTYNFNYSIFWADILRQLAEFSHAQIPLQEAIKKLDVSNQKTALTKTLSIISKQLEKGRSIEDSFISAGLVKNLASLVRFSTDSKSLENILTAMYKHLLERHRSRLQVIINWTQPILIITIGLVILFFVHSFLLPLYTYAAHIG